MKREWAHSIPRQKLPQGVYEVYLTCWNAQETQENGIFEKMFFKKCHFLGFPARFSMSNKLH